MAGVLRSYVLFLLFVLLCLVLGVASHLDPCFVASTLHAADRRTKSSDPSNGVCDLRLSNTWYRVDTGKGSNLVTSCPPAFAGCGTSFPVWLNDTIPDVTEGVVTRRACVTSLKSCCEQVLTVGVKNCGDFRVWRLPPTQACPQAYCFEDRDFMTTAAFLTTTTSMVPGFPFNSPPSYPGPPPPNDDLHGDDEDQEDLQGFEHVRRMRGMEVALGVVSTVLVLSLVLNGVLFCMFRARKQKTTCVKAQEMCKPPGTPAPPYSETRPPSSSPPPPYETCKAPDQLKVNLWVDKEGPPRF